MQPPFSCNVCGITDSPNPCVHIEAALPKPPPTLVTMAVVDAARRKLLVAIEETRKNLTLGTLNARLALEAEVEDLLRTYHAQRSPACLLVWLNHVLQCSTLWNCRDCTIAAGLAAEARL